MRQLILLGCSGPYVESTDQAALDAAKALSRKALRQLLDSQEEYDSVGGSSTATGSPTSDLS